MTYWRRKAPVSLALLSLAVLLGPLVAELDHHAEHPTGEVFLHDEARHPDADAHLEQEEHHGPEICPACVHGVAKASETLGLLGDVADSGPLLEIRLAPRSVLFAATGHPPRAPPA